MPLKYVLCTIDFIMPHHSRTYPCQFPEEARASTVAQLQGLSGCAKGLTNTTDPLLEFSTAEEDREVVRQMEVARQDARMIEMRRKIIDVLTLAMNIWSADAEVGEVRS